MTVKVPRGEAEAGARAEEARAAVGGKRGGRGRVLRGVV